MKAAVLGGTGQLGSYLQPELVAAGHEVIVLSGHTDPACDLTEPGRAARTLAELVPDLVFHLAALTNLEQCQQDPARARALHVDSVTETATWCADHHRRLVVVSTDGVFDGRRGHYHEDDEPRPLNRYAETKREGEVAALDRGALVVRTNFVGRGSQSLVANLARLFAAGRTVTGYTDAVITPLHGSEVAQALWDLADAGVTGLLHVGSTEPVTKHQLAAEIHRSVGCGNLRPGLLPQADVRRPLDTTLNSGRVRRLVDVTDRGWRRAVADSLAELRPGRREAERGGE